MTAREVGEFRTDLRDPETVCENCASRLLVVDVRWSDDQWRNVWWELEELPSAVVHTAERCRAARRSP